MASVKAVVFDSLHQDHAPDRQVHAHADRVCGYHHVGLFFRKQLGLFVADIIGKGSIDNTALDVLFPQLGGDGMNIPSGKNNQGVPGPHILRERDNFIFIDQRRHSSVAHYAVLVPAVFDDFDQPLFRFRCSTDMHSLRADSHDGGCPGAAAGSVRDHLRLVDDCHIIIVLEAEHLYGGRLMPGALDQILFLSGHQGAGAFSPVQSLILLVGKEAQGGQIDSGFRPHELFDGIVGLAGIGRSDMEHKLPVHHSGSRIEVDIFVRNSCQHQVKKPSVPSLCLFLLPPFSLPFLPENIGAVFGKFFSLPFSCIHKQLQDFSVISVSFLFEICLQVIGSRLPHPLDTVQNKCRVREKEAGLLHNGFQKLLPFSGRKDGDIFPDSL